MHIHHIIPKHEWKERFGNLVGVNSHDNKVQLTISQHAEAHGWLWEQYGRVEDKIAWLMLSKQIDTESIQKEMCRVIGKQYGPHNGRLNGLANKGKLQGTKNPMYGASRIGQLNPFYNKSHSEKTKQSLSTQAKIRYQVSHPKIEKWRIIDPNGHEMIIENLTKFCRQLGLDQGHMTKVAQGKLTTHKGYHCSKMEKI